MVSPVFPGVGTQSRIADVQAQQSAFNLANERLNRESGQDLLQLLAQAGLGAGGLATESIQAQLDREARATEGEAARAGALEQIRLAEEVRRGPPGAVPDRILEIRETAKLRAEEAEAAAGRKATAAGISDVSALARTRVSAAGGAATARVSGEERRKTLEFEQELGDVAPEDEFDTAAVVLSVEALNQATQLIGQGIPGPPDAAGNPTTLPITVQDLERLSKQFFDAKIRDWVRSNPQQAVLSPGGRVVLEELQLEEQGIPQIPAPDVPVSPEGILPGQLRRPEPLPPSPFPAAPLPPVGPVPGAIPGGPIPLQQRAAIRRQRALRQTPVLPTGRGLELQRQFERTSL